MFIQVFVDFHQQNAQRFNFLVSNAIMIRIACMAKNLMLVVKSRMV